MVPWLRRTVAGAKSPRSDAASHTITACHLEKLLGKDPLKQLVAKLQGLLWQMPHLSHLLSHVRSLWTQKRPKSQEREHQAPEPKRVYSPLRQDDAGEGVPCQLSNPKKYQLCLCPSAQGQLASLSEAQHPKGYQLHPREEHPLPALKSPGGKVSSAVLRAVLNWDVLYSAGFFRELVLAEQMLSLDVARPQPLVCAADTHLLLCVF